MSAVDPTIEIPSALPPAERGVVLWGAPGAGKSGLLGALYAASIRSDLSGWSAHPRDCDDAYTQQRLKDAYLGLIERTNAKTGLPSGSEYAPLRLMLRRARGRRETAALRIALIDPAGEFSTQLDLAGTPAGRALFGRVARASGVLWLFEATPTGSAGVDADAIGARLLALQHLVALLEHGGGEQLQIPIALCLSKIDQLPLEQRAAARSDPAAALRAQLGETAFTWFEAVCPSIRCFAISSAGDVEGRVQPEGTEAVFDWLREHVERAPSLGARLGQLIASIPRPPRAAMRTLATVAIVAGAVGVLGAVGTIGAAKVKAMIADVRTKRPAAPTRPASTSTGEVTPVSDGVGAARLGAALRASNRGDWEATLAALNGATPPATLRFAWDSLYVVAALAAASDASDGDAARKLFTDARGRTTEMLRRAPGGSRRMLPFRYARAVACLDGHLGCSATQIRDDLTWALLGSREMHAAARDRLEALDAEVTR